MAFDLTRWLYDLRTSESFGMRLRVFAQALLNVERFSGVILVKSLARRVLMSDIIKSVQQFYNEAGEYFSKTRQKRYGGDDATWPEMRPYLAELKKDDRVLDLGCGNGRLLTGIKAEVEYLGVDFSETLIEEARKLHPQEKFVLGDITSSETWKKINGKYDAIFCVATLHHLPERKQHLYVIRQAKKHLKRSGVLYISVWNLWNKRYWVYHLRSVGMKLRNWRWLRVPFAGKWERFCFAYDKRYLSRLVKDAGLEIEELYYSDGKGGKSGIFGGRNLVAVVNTQ